MVFFVVIIFMPTPDLKQSNGIEGLRGADCTEKRSL